MAVKTYTGTLVIEDCCTCHITFGITRAMYNWLQSRTDENFYCPNGHPQHYTGKSDEQIAKDEKLRADRAENQLRYTREQLAASRDVAKAADYRARAYKGQITKARRRVGNGVCPCCQRTFPQLASHMADKHPDYAAATP